MNPKLPKPLQEALARQAGGEAHPSADVLTSFAEHTLPNPERQLVTNHVAQCADCREILFLASNAAEEPAVIEDEDLMVASGVPRLSPVLMAKAHAASPAASTVSVEAPRQRWALRLVWAVPVAAAVLLSFGVWFTPHRALKSAAPQLASKAGNTAPAPPVAEPQHVIAEQGSGEPAGSAKDEVQPAPTKSARAKAAPGRRGDTVALSITASKSEENFPSAPAAAPKDATSQPAFDIIGETAKAMAQPSPTQHSFAESPAEAEARLRAYSRPPMVKPTMSARGINAAHATWRITPDGHLEHLIVPGNWTRVLGDQPTMFHVVSVVGDQVWAGGSGGALLHSSDGGQHWSRIALATDTGADTATITAIRFDDPQHGMVITDSGSHWSTSDGGITWTKQ